MAFPSFASWPRPAPSGMSSRPRPAPCRVQTPACPPCLFLPPGSRRSAMTDRCTGPACLDQTGKIARGKRHTSLTRRSEFSASSQRATSRNIGRYVRHFRLRPDLGRGGGQGPVYGAKRPGCDKAFLLIREVHHIPAEGCRRIPRHPQRIGL